MKQKKETEPMITADEAVRNSAFSTAYELNFRYEIYKKYRSAGNQYDDELRQDLSRVVSAKMIFFQKQ